MLDPPPPKTIKDSRYPQIERLEQMMGRTSVFTQCLSNLHGLDELIVFCDSGLGRLMGPERSWIVFCTPAVDRFPHLHCRPVGLPTRSERPAPRPTPIQTLPLTSFWDRPPDSSISVRGALQAWGFPRFSLLDQPRSTIVPASLSNLQKEVLLEFGLVQEAFLRSLSSAIVKIRQRDGGGFRNLSILRLAKISSGHLRLLCDDSFWGSLPQLDTVHLGVVPEWRRMALTEQAGVNEEQATPSTSADTVFELLSVISKQKRISVLFFEWLCGGESGPGSQRNRFILPAPFTRHAEQHLDPRITFTSGALIELPYIRYLSLKNCWSTPHTFLYVIQAMARQSLTDLKLESVSLTGLPHWSPPDLPVAEGEIGQHHRSSPFWNLGQPIQNFGFQEPVDQDPPRDEALVRPNLLTWSGIINVLSAGRRNPAWIPWPNPPSDEMDPSVKYLPYTEDLPTVQRMELVSCGYAALDNELVGILPGSETLLMTYWWSSSDYHLVHPHFTEVLSGEEHKYEDMQNNADDLLGYIFPVIHPREIRILKRGFGLQVDGEYTPSKARLAMLNGTSVPRYHRFGGVISKRHS